MIEKSLVDKFHQRAVRGPNCWGWTGYFDKAGYAMVPKKMRSISAHRISYEIFKGAIPDGLCVCHKCDNRGCTNPDHLFLGSHIDNMIDRQIKGRTARGEKSGRAKLTDQEIIGLRKMHKNRYYSHSDIGLHFGISRNQARLILIGASRASSS